jgi:hypothetical protein
VATRRDFVISVAASTLPGIISSGVAGPATAATEASLREDTWDQGRLAHLLPTVSHDRFLIKASFDRPLAAAPDLGVGTNRVRGQRNPGDGTFWQFDAGGLEPATTYRLSLTGDDGRALCEPWPLSTFPAPDAMPPRLGGKRFRALHGEQGRHCRRYACVGERARAFRDHGQRDLSGPYALARDACASATRRHGEHGGRVRPRCLHAGDQTTGSAGRSGRHGVVPDQR